MIQAGQAAHRPAVEALEQKPAEDKDQHYPVVGQSKTYLVCLGWKPPVGRLHLTHKSSEQATQDPTLAEKQQKTCTKSINEVAQLLLLVKVR